MKKIFTLLFLFNGSLFVFGQDAYLKGTISDSKTKETIVGASVIIDNLYATTTDINGLFSIKTTSGNHKVEFKFVGYTSQVKTIELKENETSQMNVALEPESKQLDIVVVSAGRFQQNLNEVTVSMEVLKPSLIENKSIQSVDNAIDQVPGVNVIDGQANIRGGSGFSYGAGSRVLVMVDEMPMLTADAGDVKWNFLPIENCEQIEVIKGASSALFGSSAMNGVINFRTAYAKEDPETKINFFGGVYDKPKRKEMVWWADGDPTYAGVNFFHAQKINKLDFVVAGNVYNDDGYRYLETEQRYRTNINLRYRFDKKLEGLQIGVNANTMRTKGGLFLIWENADSGAYRPVGGDVSHYTTYRTNVDPFITYNTKHNGRHTLRTRFFRTINLNTTDQESTADVYYSEYQYQKHFEKGLTTTFGAVYNYNEVHSGPLYGTHFSNNAAMFTQIDKKWDRLSISLGLRGEYYKTDSVETREDVYFLMDRSKPIAKETKVKPVFRAGINYRVAQATFLRASFGQGFRFPSVAEKFIMTSASGLDIYPNDSLKPESGWSTEIAVRQGFVFGEWKGFVDAALFWTEYNSMMEFSFGQFGPLIPPYSSPHQLGLGFQSQNIGNTRISGLDMSIAGQGKIGPVNVNLLLAYTYIDPIQTDFNEAVDTSRNSAKTNILKYRYKHSGKADVELGYKKFTTGINMRANSYMENVDAFFILAFDGLKEYRNVHDKGDAIFDYRLSYQLNKTAKISFIVNNIFNREVMGRPMDIQAPRVYAFQLTIKL